MKDALGRGGSPGRVQGWEEAGVGQETQGPGMLRAGTQVGNY